MGNSWLYYEYLVGMAWRLVRSCLRKSQDKTIRDFVSSRLKISLPAEVKVYGDQIRAATVREL